MSQPILLVVDDDPLMANLVANVGEMCGFDVFKSGNANEFQSALKEHNPAVIVMDVVMPDIDGIELLTWLAEQKCSTPIILMSGYGGRYLDMADTLGTAKGITISGVLAKPFEIDELEFELGKICALSPG